MQYIELTVDIKIIMYLPLLWLSLRIYIARTSYWEVSCKTEASRVSINSPCIIYKLRMEIIAFSELKMMSPDFNSNFCYARASDEELLKAKALITTPLSLIMGLILDSLMFR